MRKTLMLAAACSLPVLAVASASQAQLSGVRSVTVDQEGTASLHIAEIEAFESGTGTNVASQSNGGVATASSSGFGTEPADANDGNTNGAFGDGSVWHSGADGTAEFVTVTFSQDRTINSLSIYGRTDCCQERDNTIDVILRGAGAASSRARDQRKWLMQIAEGSERRKPTDLAKLNDWYARLTRLLERAIRVGAIDDTLKPAVDRALASCGERKPLKV